MSQVNKYADRAAYASDTDRLSTQSAVSLIASDNEIVYDGVNVVVGKDAASVGDCAVYDKTAGAIRFIKGETLSAAQLPATLTPLAVVYARQGDKVLIVALDNIADGQRWAHSYEVALSGFDLTAGGTFTLRLYSGEVSFTYEAGATLNDIASVMAGKIPGYNSSDFGGWTVAAADDAVIMTSNTYMDNRATIEVVSGCEIRYTPENKNYQTGLTGVLLDEGQTIEYVRRNNGIVISPAGCNMEKFLQYYSANGTVPTSNIPLGSATIVNQESFEMSEFCAELRAAYADYASYLFGEHMAQYPSAYGAMLRDGRTNTAKIGSLRFVDILGKSAPCYPAAAAALEYAVTIDGATTGLEAGGWWLPSVEEVYLLMYDRAATSANVERDPVNRTLSRLSKATCYGANFNPWTSCEYNMRYPFMYYGSTGVIGSLNSKYNANTVRPVSAL